MLAAPNNDCPSRIHSVRRDCLERKFLRSYLSATREAQSARHAGCTLPKPFNDSRWDPEVWRSTLKDFGQAGGDKIRLFYNPSRWLFSQATAITVVDVGSFVGNDLISLFGRGVPKSLKIHTFEPVPKTRKVLTENLRRARHANQVHIWPFGLSARNLTACVEGTAAGQFLLEMQGQKTECGTPNALQAPVRLLDAAEAFASVVRRSGRAIEALQINCEGCELPILERLISLDAQDSRLARAIEVQFHPQHVAPLAYCRVEAGLRSLGYVLEYRFEYVWERWIRPGFPRLTDHV